MKDKRELIITVLTDHRFEYGPGFCAGCDYEPDAETLQRTYNSMPVLMREHQADVLVERLGL